MANLSDKVTPTGVLTPNGNGSGLTSLTSANLTGALPAISGAALTGLSAGALTFISSSDLSNDATADFTGFNASLYDSYEFVFAAIIPSVDFRILEMRTSTNGGTSYDSGLTDYQHSLIYQTGNVSNAGAQGTNDILSSIRLAATPVGNSAGAAGVSGVVNVLNPHLAVRTTITSSLGHWNNGLSSTVGSGVRNSSADVDAVRFFFNSDNMASGTITMYGKVNS